MRKHTMAMEHYQIIFRYSFQRNFSVFFMQYSAMLYIALVVWCGINFSFGFILNATMKIRIKKEHHVQKLLFE